MKKSIAIAAIIISSLFATANATFIEFPLASVELGTRSDCITVEVDGVEISIAPAGGIGYVSAGKSWHVVGAEPILGPRYIVARSSEDFYSPTPIRFSFSKPVTEIEFGYFDQGGDNDGNVIITGYDSMDNEIFSHTHYYGTAFGKISGTLMVNGATDFILQTTGRTNLNSLSWSVRNVTVVPEPVTLALLAVGTLALRKRRA